METRGLATRALSDNAFVRMDHLVPGSPAKTMSAQCWFVGATLLPGMLSSHQG